MKLIKQNNYHNYNISFLLLHLFYFNLSFSMHILYPSVDKTDFYHLPMYLVF